MGATCDTCCGDERPRSASELQLEAWSRAVAEGNLPLVQQLHMQSPSLVETVIDNKKGLFALHVAAAHNQDAILRYLLRYGHAEVDMTTKDGNTALHVACRKNTVRAIRLLVSYGADAQKKNDAGQTPHSLAKHLTRRKFLRPEKGAPTMDEAGLTEGEQDDTNAGDDGWFSDEDQGGEGSDSESVQETTILLGGETVSLMAAPREIQTLDSINDAVDTAPKSAQRAPHPLTYFKVHCRVEVDEIAECVQKLPVEQMKRVWDKSEERDVTTRRRALVKMIYALTQLACRTEQQRWPGNTRDLLAQVQRVTKMLIERVQVMNAGIGQTQKKKAGFRMTKSQFVYDLEAHLWEIHEQLLEEDVELALKHQAISSPGRSPPP